VTNAVKRERDIVVPAIAAMALAFAAASQAQHGGSEAKPSPQHRYSEYAKKDAERQQQACETAIADYRARCPIRGGNPHFQSEECAKSQAFIVSRCHAEGKR
jgi:hypothetical protein